MALLAAAGITPDAVAGHSVGEVTAAYAAGVLSLEDACRLVAARARLMQALPGGGAMTAIAAAEAEAAAAIQGLAGVSIAAVNGPSSVVISGDTAAVDGVAEVFRAQGRRVKALRVSHAFHSHRMDPVLDELGQVAAGLEHAAPRMPWACGLTGELVSGCEPGYWVRQAREPVRFAAAVAALAARQISVFIEIGPDGTLSALGPAAVGPAGVPGAADQETVFIPLLRPASRARRGDRPRWPAPTCTAPPWTGPPCSPSEPDRPAHLRVPASAVLAAARPVTAPAGGDGAGSGGRGPVLGRGGGRGPAGAGRHAGRR